MGVVAASWLLIALLFLCLTTAPSFAQSSKKKKSPGKIRQEVHQLFDFKALPAVQAFVQQMQTEHGFQTDELYRYFHLANHRPDVIRLMNPAPPGFKRSWQIYRSRNLDELRIREGLKFWQAHADALDRAQQRFGVAPEIIVAIIGVETVYGRVTGDFKVFEALATLAFDYPRREAFFRSELEQFLILAREQGWNPLTVRGSYAGAIGYPQFMPGSIRRHATDFSGDGRIDLVGTPEDAIGSIGQFLVNHGWQANQPTHVVVQVEDAGKVSEWLAKGIKPIATTQQLIDSGVKFPSPTSGSRQAGEPFALIEFPTPDQPSEWIAAANNFYVITRYNQSSFYARAVLELAETLARMRAGQSQSNHATQPGKTPVER